MYRGQTRFRSPTWVKGLLSFSAVLVPFLAYMEYRTENVTWVFVVLFILSPMMVAGVIAVFTDGIDLHKNELRIKHNFRRSSIRRANIDNVTWGKGVGVSLKLKDGSSLILPDIGLNSQSVCNSVRAWVKAA